MFYSVVRKLEYKNNMLLYIFKDTYDTMCKYFVLNKCVYLQSSQTTFIWHKL
jgi:hypothetical protein